MPNYDDLPFAPLPGRGANPDQYWQALVYHVFTTLRVGQPATVVAWNPAVPAKQLPATVDVRMDFEQIRAINNAEEVQADRGERLVTQKTGLLAVAPRPVFRNRPYVVTGVGPAFSMRGPIAAGTTGLYIVVDRCIDQWINKGGPLDPADAAKHDLNDGFFLPLVYHGNNTPNIPTDVHQLGPDDGNAGLEIATGSASTPGNRSMRLYTDGPNMTIDAATLIKLGANAVQGVARLSDDVSPKAAMTAWALVVETFINGIAPGTFTPANSFAGTVANAFGVISSASTKVQAE